MQRLGDSLIEQFGPRNYSTVNRLAPQPLEAPRLLDEQRVMGALYRAMVEYQSNALPAGNVGVGTLNVRLSAIYLRAEQLIREPPP